MKVLAEYSFEWKNRVKVIPLECPLGRKCCEVIKRGGDVSHDKINTEDSVNMFPIKKCEHYEGHFEYNGFDGDLKANCGVSNTVIFMLEEDLMDDKIKWNEGKRIKLYRKAKAKWGFNSQVAVAIEELGELTVELAKILNSKRNPDDNQEDADKLIDELTDSQIMIEQIILNYHLSAEVFIRKHCKLNRLEKILSGEVAHPHKPREDK